VAVGGHHHEGVVWVRSSVTGTVVAPSSGAKVPEQEKMGCLRQVVQKFLSHGLHA